MAFGIIKADTLTHSTAGSVGTDFVVQGSAKAWSNYTSSTTTSYRDSHNFTSIIDDEPGVTTHSFVSSMANNDYSVSTSASAVETGTGSLGGTDHARNYTTSSFKHVTATGAAALTDRPHINNQVCGDLA